MNIVKRSIFVAYNHTNDAVLLIGLELFYSQAALFSICMNTMLNTYSVYFVNNNNILPIFVL